MLANIFDSSFELSGRARKKTQSKDGTQSGVERIISVLGEALQDAGIQKDQLSGIGLGIPGPLDPDSGVVIDTPNLGWHNLRLREPIEAAFGCPVFIINDVDAGVFGEYRFGAGQGMRCTVGIFPGTGVGGGCVYEGQILTGKNRSCFEIGHIPVVPDGPLCGCGQRGCLETVASRLAISASAAAAVYRGEAPNLQAIAGTDLSKIRSGALSEAIRAGDAVIEEIVRNGARWLGIGVTTIINLLAPDIIVLGGGLVEAMPDIYLEEVSRVANSRVMAPLRNVTKIVVSKLGDDAVAKGAAAWAEARLNGRTQQATS